MSVRLIIDFDDIDTMVKWIGDMKGLDPEQFLIPHNLGLMPFGTDGKPDRESPVYWFSTEDGVRGVIGSKPA
jgi:hypothetical protein